MRMVKSYGSKSRQMMWLNAKNQRNITIKTHVYISSENSLDFFKNRETQETISIRNLTFNNGGL